jgi:cytochrome c
MKDCPPGELHSTLPAVSRNAHGNIALQNRTFGPVRGVDTGKPATGAAAAPSAAPAPAKPAGALALAQQNACLACHGIDNKVVGPGFAQVAARYKGDAGAPARLAARIRAGGSGAWGQVPMPPQAQLQDAEAQALANWILSGAK